MLEIEFDGQKEGEEVLALFHKHPMVFGRDILIALALLAIIVISLINFGFSSTTSWAIFICLPLSILFLIRFYYLWSNNLFLITNTRIIAMVQKGFFSRRLEESYLDDICQVNARVYGFVHSWLDYGNVEIQTEGLQTLEDVEHPYDVKNAAYNVIRKFKDKDTRPAVPPKKSRPVIR